MFTNRTPDGRNNIAGIKVAELRKNLRISQRELADRLAVIGLDTGVIPMAAGLKKQLCKRE